MDEDAVLGHDADLDAAAREQLVQLAVAVAVQQRLDLGGRFVPALLSAVSRACFDTATSAASSSLLQTICTCGMAAISSPTSSKIELRK